MVWTSDQVIELVTAVSSIVGSIVIILHKDHTNKEVQLKANERANDNVPTDVVHRILDNVVSVATDTAKQEAIKEAVNAARVIVDNINSKDNKAEKEAGKIITPS